MIDIYILLLESNKYYVGKSKNTIKRINKHFDQNNILNKTYASAWTSLHKPIKILDIINNCNIFDEDKYTLMMMNKYGIDNVRGGSFTSIKLPDEEINIIEKMLLGANDSCYNCGDSHFISRCKLKNINKNLLTLRQKILKVINKYTKVMDCNEFMNVLKNINVFENINESNFVNMCNKLKITIEDNKLIDCNDFIEKLIEHLNDSHANLT